MAKEVTLIKQAVFIDTDKNGVTRVASIRNLVLYPVEFETENRDGAIHVKARMPVSYEVVSRKVYGKDGN